MKTVFKLIATVLLLLVPLTIGAWISFQVAPVSQRVAFNACMVVGYETVFCDRKQDDSFYYFNVVGVRGQEIVQVTHRIPKKKIGMREL